MSTADDVAQTGATPYANGAVNVRFYGATGDGVTDDTVAIQAATMMAIAEGKPVYIPSGRYRASGKLVADATIRVFGDGPNLTVIDVNKYGGVVFEVRQQSQIENLTIIGDSPLHGATAIATAKGSQWWLSCVRNVHFKNIGATIDVDGAWGASLENVFCVAVGSGPRLISFNGGRIDRLYVNRHTMGHALFIGNSRAWTVQSLVTENNVANSFNRVHLQGCECGTIDGWYVEGAQGIGSYDIFFGAKSGVGATENIVVNNAWMNSNGASRVAAIGIAAGMNITLSNFHWHTPSADYISSYIDTNITGSHNTVTVRNWIREGGDDGIPLGDHHDYVVCEGTFTAEFLTTPDDENRLPFVADNPVEYMPGEVFDAWTVSSGSYRAVTYGADSVPLYVPKAGIVRIPLRGTVTSSTGVRPFFRLGTTNVTNGRVWESAVTSVSASGQVEGCNVYVVVDAGWNQVRLGISREQGGSGRNTWTPLVSPNMGSLPVVKAIICTISVDNESVTDDYHFEGLADATKQMITLRDVLPAYAGLLGWQVRCFQTVTASAAMQIDIGITSGGDELGTASVNTANDVVGTTVVGVPQLAAMNVARSIYVSGTPGANWNTLHTGRWAVVLTYIDHATVYAQKAP